MIESSLEDKKKKSRVKKTPLESVTDTYVEQKIRPNKFSDIIGRENEKNTILTMISGAKGRGEVIDHILFYGLGKTTFAISIANEIGTNIKITSGPAIERSGDLAAILTNLAAGDILFIDEVHRLPKVVEEVLYPAMEDRVIDIVMGKGPSAKTVRLQLEPFTLVGATTQIGKIGSPMRDRFGLIQRLDYFKEDDLLNILKRAAKLWGIKYEKGALEEIAKRSRGTARVALRLLRRVRDFADNKSIDIKCSTSSLDQLGIDQLGLEQIDRKIISIIYKDFNGGPVGLSTLAASISEDVDTLSEVYEPYLMKCGLMKRTFRGRVLTENGIRKAIEILGLTSII